MKYIFRFDDVCVNSDIQLLENIAWHLLETFNCEIIYGVSPLVNSTEKKTQRVFPSWYGSYSSHTLFYKADECGIPKLIEDKRISYAGHGLVHLDHRLIPKDAQELSIVTSCSLVNAKIFIPPFNKWNKDTEEVCRENGIELIKFEDGWLSMEHNSFNKEHKKWYLHAREWTLDKVKTWFNG